MAERSPSRTSSQKAVAKLSSRIKPASLRQTPSPTKRHSTLSDASRISVTSSKQAPTSETTVETKGPSIFALLATKRLVRRLADRVVARRVEREVTATQQHEPTYQMNPKNSFNCSEVKKAIEEIALSRLQSLGVYTHRKCTMVSKILSEEIKDRIKSMGYDRYKLVCIITMGENASQGLDVTSRCSWNPKHDSYVTYNWQNVKIFCSITVYGIYFE